MPAPCGRAWNQVRNAANSPGSQPDCVLAIAEACRASLVTLPAIQTSATGWPDGPWAVAAWRLQVVLVSLAAHSMQHLTTPSLCLSGVSRTHSLCVCLLTAVCRPSQTSDVWRSAYRLVRASKCCEHKTSSSTSIVHAWGSSAQPQHQHHSRAACCSWLAAGWQYPVTVVAAHVLSWRVCPCPSAGEAGICWQGPQG